MINQHTMKNKTLSAYKKKKLIESFCDELTATQAAHRLNLDRNTVNKYFKRIRECIAGYREYQKMHLMISRMSHPADPVPVISKQFVTSHPHQGGIAVNLICLSGQLLTDLDRSVTEASTMMLHVSDYVREHLNGHNELPDGADSGMENARTMADAFHDFATRRFKKYFGIHSDFAYLYIKEAEFVFNERDHGKREKLLHQMMEQIFA